MQQSQSHIVYPRSPKRARAVPLLLGLLAMLCTSCVTDGKFVWVDDTAAESTAPKPYRIHIGDNLRVYIWKQDDLTGDVLVRPDGNITIPLAGDIAVVNQTPEDAAKNITKRLTAYIRDAQVTVAVVNGYRATATVIGEVRTPGKVDLVGEDSILDVIARAGGMTEFARRERIFVVREGASEPRVRFSYNKITNGESLRGLTYFLRDGDVVVVE